MPRYRYSCQDCDSEKMVFHLYSESPIVICDVCESQLVRGLTSPSLKKEVVESNAQVGKLTKQYIEDNRKLLKEEQQKARKQTYEPT